MYHIEILTQQGVKNVTFDPKTQSLERLEIELKQKYGNFTTLKSTFKP